jgi:hypothetical protein
LRGISEMKRVILAIVVIGIMAHINTLLPETGPSWKTWPGAYAVFGFVACTALMWGGKLLRVMGITRPGDNNGE